MSRGLDVVGQVASALERLDDGAGLWLFGSCARGRTHAASDVDALVTVSDRSHLQEVRELCVVAGLSAIVTDRDQLWRLPAKSPLLALHLSTEAVPLAGKGELPPVAWQREHQDAATRRALSRLDAARHEVAVWGADDSSAQTMVFAAVKEWAMLQAAVSGRPEFDRWRALSALVQTSVQRRALAQLETVWLAKRSGTTPPELSDPEWATSEALTLAPIVARA